MYDLRKRDGQGDEDAFLGYYDINIVVSGIVNNRNTTGFAFNDLRENT